MRLTVALVVVSALVDVWSAVTPAVPMRLRLLADVFSFDVRAFSRLVAALAGFALVLLARGLARRKRAAWVVTLVVLAVSVVAHLVKGLDVEEGAFATLLIVLLLLTRRRFVARPDLPSLWQGVRVLLLAFGFTLFYGVLGFFVLDRQFGEQFGVLEALRSTVGLFLFGPSPLPRTRLAEWFLGSVYLIAATSFGVALLALLRPVVLRAGPSAAAHAEAARIVEAHGVSSLARFALLGDKQFFFGSGGASLVAYKAVRGVGLALGDPIGPLESVAETVQGFKIFCEQQGWQPAFYQTLPDHLEAYQAAGFAVLPIGQEAVVDLAGFTLAGGGNKNLRNTLNKLGKAGYTARLYDPPQSPARLADLKRVSDAWLQDKHGSEKSFSLGAFSDDYIGSSPVMAVEDGAGRIVAFANFVTEYQKNELTLDLMRFSDTAPDDTMLFLFLKMLEHAQGQGYDSFNLGLVALAGLAESPDASRAEKALRLIYERFNQVYNFKGLYAFKSKFHPCWEPRYLVYATPGDLLSTLEAVALADSSVGVWGEVRAELARRLAPKKEEAESVTESVSS